MTDREHTLALTWAEALDLVESVNGELGSAMKLLMKPAGRPVYRATYRYGDAIIDQYGKLCPPCFISSCKACADLKQACRDDLPLALVIQESCEVYLQWSESQTIPLRLLNEGELFGLFELLDKLHPNPIGKTKQPRWRVSAGARSVYITSPFSTEPLGKALRALLPRDIVEKLFPRHLMSDKAVSKRLQDNPYFLVRFLEKAAINNKPTLKPWTATVLIFPSAMLLPMLKKGSAFVDAAKNFLLRIHGTAWVQSRNLRIREVEADDIEKHFLDRNNRDKSLLAHAIQQVLAISRGDQPAFVPYSNQIMAGPFGTVQEFFLLRKLNEKLSQPTFPAIMQPCHIGEGDGRSSFGYFSLSVACLIGQGSESFSQSLADDLVIHLKNKFAQDCRISLHISLADDPAFQSDFAYQFGIAHDQWHVKRDDFFRDFKQGFTLRFVRVESSKAATAEPKVLRAAG